MLSTGSKQIVKNKMKGLLAERLTALRKANGMTATQCAAELEMSIAAWSQWEKAKRDPSLEDLPKICWMFSCSMDDLFQTNRKSCPGGNISVRAGAGGMAINVSNNKIGGSVWPISIKGSQPPNCRTCPHLKKLKALEKVLNKA